MKKYFLYFVVVLLCVVVQGTWAQAPEPTEIKTITDLRGLMDDAWYDLSGHKLTGRPTKKGLYIHRGKKVVVSW